MLTSVHQLMIAIHSSSSDLPQGPAAAEGVELGAALILQGGPKVPTIPEAVGSAGRTSSQKWVPDFRCTHLPILADTFI